MGQVVMQAETLNLPDMFAVKFRGKMVELTEHEDTVLIKPVRGSFAGLRGMFKSDGCETDRFMARKQAEKELEYAGEIHT